MQNQLLLGIEQDAEKINVAANEGNEFAQDIIFYFDEFIDGNNEALHKLEKAYYIFTMSEVGA